MLDSSKAMSRLGWRPRLPFDDSLRLTAAWYARRHAGTGSLREEIESQVRYHSTLAQTRPG